MSITKIGWAGEQDIRVYQIMKKHGFTGLEIESTRVFSDKSNDKLEEVKTWAKSLKNGYGFVIPPIQSIWFGQQEKCFGTDQERIVLANYTKKVVDFAAGVCCNNNETLEQPFDDDVRTSSDCFFGSEDGYIMSCEEELKEVEKFVLTANCEGKK